jgi:hypothetical protein
MRSSLVRSMAPELNSGEGVGPSDRGAAVRLDKASGPTHVERGGVRWLGTDGVAENRGERGGDGLPEADRRPIARTTSKTEGSFYSSASRGSNAGLCKERGKEVTAWRGGRAAGRASARAAQRHSGNGRREGHVKGEILSVRQPQMVSWTWGVHPGVHATQQGVSVHRAYPATRARGQRYAGT